MTTRNYFVQIDYHKELVIGEVLGQGSYGRVYQVFWSRKRRHVAVKQFFREENTSLAKTGPETRFSHPNLVEILGTSVDTIRGLSLIHI